MLFSFPSSLASNRRYCARLAYSRVQYPFCFVLDHTSWRSSLDSGNLCLPFSAHGSMMWPQLSQFVFVHSVFFVGSSGLFGWFSVLLFHLLWWVNRCWIV